MKKKPASLNSLSFVVKFANNSEARGALVILNYMGPHGPQLIQSRYLIASKEETSKGYVVHNLEGGHYSFSVFDVEGDGLVEEKRPAYWNQMIVDGEALPGMT